MSIKPSKLKPKEALNLRNIDNLKKNDQPKIKCDYCRKELKGVSKYFTCEDCKKLFCQTHRWPEDHNCIKWNIEWEKEVKEKPKGKLNEKLKKNIDILFVILLIIGVIILRLPSSDEPPIISTVPPSTTPPPTTLPPSTTVQITAPPYFLTTNPKLYVLTLEEVGRDYYSVTKSEYKDLDTYYETSSKDYTALKKGGYIDDYRVEFSNDKLISKNITNITNVISRFVSKADAEAALESFRDHYTKENYPESIHIGTISGREFGDGTLYAEAIFGSEEKVLQFTKENYKVFILVEGKINDVSVTHLYPYAEILENRISRDEQIIPPPIS